MSDLDKMAAENLRRAREAEQRSNQLDQLRAQQLTSSYARQVRANIPKLLEILKQRGAPDAEIVHIEKTVRIGGRFFGHDETALEEKAAWLLYSKRRTLNCTELYYLLSDGKTYLVPPTRRYPPNSPRIAKECDIYGEGLTLTAINALIEKYR